MNEHSVSSKFNKRHCQEEVQFAEREVIKHVQRKSFPDVIRAMQLISSSKPSHSSKPSSGKSTV